MAGAKSGVHVLQLKRAEVPDSLQKGQRFYKYDDVETSSNGTFIIMRVDPKGHIVYWTSTATGDKDYIEIINVLDTRWGKLARFSKDVDKAREKLCPSFIPASSCESCHLTIVTGNNFVDIKYTTFVAPSPALAQEWAEKLFQLAYDLLGLNGSFLHYLDQSYAKIRYASGSDKEIFSKDIVDHLAVHRDDRKKVENALVAANLPAAREDSLPVEQFTEDQFFLFYRCLTQRVEVQKIFSEIEASGNSNSKKQTNSKGVPVISVSQFVNFLNNEQRDPRLNEILYPLYNERTAQRLINVHEPNKEMAQKGLLTIDGFLRFSLSDDNRCVAEEYFDLRTEDLKEPISHYFINSSHNTYLAGPQLGISAKSSVEMYRQVLLSGCRCVELDFWDGQNDQPRITHGPTAITLVPDIPVKDVFEAIAETAFKTSDYPVVLSFELKCNEKNQSRIAQLCRDIFKDLLLTEPLALHPTEGGVALPSPSMLKRKILIKCRKISLSGSRQSSRKQTKPTATFFDVSSPILIDPQPDAPIGDVQILSPENKPPIVDQDSVDDVGQTSTAEHSIADSTAPPIESDEESSTSDVDEPGAKTNVPFKVSKELSALAIYCTGSHFRSFEEASKKNVSYEMFSFSENIAMGHIRRNVTDLVNYNKRQISRIYPGGFRFSSSNYMPHIFWSAGCQMVALNFQTLATTPMQLNQGIFEMNGRSGYLLKPECMRKMDRHFDPFEENSVENVVANTVSVLVLSGQFLSKNKVSTYVEIELYGLPVDCVIKRDRFKTRTVSNNGINPVYADKDARPFEIPKIVLPDLASIRFVVYDDSSRSMIGHRILPINALRPGYRHISLRNELGQALGLPTLFVKICVKDFVPLAHLELVTALRDPIAYMNRVQAPIRDFADALVNPIEHRKKMEKREQMLKEMIDPDFQQQQQTDDLPKLVSETSIPLKSTDSSNLLTNGIAPSKIMPSPPPPQVQSVRSTHPFVIGVASSSSSTSADMKRRISQAGAGAGKNLIENYPFNLPSLEMFDRDKKINRKCRQHDKEIKLLKDKQNKDLNLLCKKQERKHQEFLRMQQKLLASLTQANERALRKPTSADTLEELKAQLNRKEEQLKRDQVDEIQSLKDQQYKEKRQLCSRHWQEEWLLIQSQHENLLTAHVNAVDLSHRYSMKTLETLHKKEIEKIMKATETQRKVDWENLQKTAVSKDQFAQQKKDAEDTIIRKGVEQRKSLETSRKAKEEEINKCCEEIKEHIKQNLALKLDELRKDYDTRISQGDQRQTDITPL